GWASVVALQCVFSGMILLALGAIGDYVARTYEETKNRPLYVVTELYNLPLPVHPPARAIVLEERDPLAALTADSLGSRVSRAEELVTYRRFAGVRR
ncbi:MAG: hypothetical protein ACRD28_10290, partial [Acidobacteriaceae bacterium]